MGSFFPYPVEALCGRLKRRRPTQPLRGRHRSPAADTDMPVSTHRPYFAKLALGSFSVFKWQPCASRPAVRHRSPAADSECRCPTQPLRGRHGIPGAGRHGTWRRPTRHLPPADTALAAGRHSTWRRPTRTPSGGRHAHPAGRLTAADTDLVQPIMGLLAKV